MNKLARLAPLALAGLDLTGCTAEVPPATLSAPQCSETLTRECLSPEGYVLGNGVVKQAGECVWSGFFVPTAEVVPARDGSPVDPEC